MNSNCFKQESYSHKCNLSMLQYREDELLLCFRKENNWDIPIFLVAALYPSLSHYTSTFWLYNLYVVPIHWVYTSLTRTNRTYTLF